MSRISLWSLVALAIAMLGVHVPLAMALDAYLHEPIFHWVPLEVAIYALAAVVVWRDTGRAPVVKPRLVVFGILAVAALLRVMLLFSDPVSTDINRYIWDGRVQGAGINPYRYIPADPALADLRDDDIYPEINRKEYAPTIYPPLAEMVFFAVTQVSEEPWVMKAAMVAFEAAAIWAMLRLLAARGQPPTRILLYAWHPLPIWEFAGSGHVDAIVLACVCLGLAAADSGRRGLAGVAFAGAALTKFFPVLVVPAAYRRWDWKLPLAGLATTMLLYLPYIGVGRKAFGFLSGYSAEEGLKDGSGLYPWAALKALVPGLPQGLVVAYMPLAALVLAGLGMAVLFRRRACGADIGGACLLATAFTILTSPHYPWYLAWLVPFLCFRPSPALTWLTGSAVVMYIAGWPPSLAAGSFFYLPFFALLAAEETFRRRRTKEQHGNPVAAQF